MFGEALEVVADALRRFSQQGFTSLDREWAEITLCGLSACLGQFVGERRFPWMVALCKDFSQLGFAKAGEGVWVAPLCIPMANQLEAEVGVCLGGFSRIWDGEFGWRRPGEALYRAGEALRGVEEVLSKPWRSQRRLLSTSTSKLRSAHAWAEKACKALRCSSPEKEPSPNSVEEVVEELRRLREAVEELWRVLREAVEIEESSLAGWRGV